MGKEKGLVLSLFADEAAADEAVESLQAWDKLEDDVKLHGIGTIVLDENGKLKIHKAGRIYDFAKGAGVGAVAVILAGALFAPVIDVAMFGAFALFYKNLRISPEQRERLSAELTNGKAAVAVLVTREEVAAVLAKLTELGGSSEELIEVEMTPELDAAAAKADAEASVQAAG